MAKPRRTPAPKAIAPAPTLRRVRPFLKWAGGKTQLLAQLRPLYPDRKKIVRYLEPFLGSGAVFFHVQAVLQPKAAILCDRNRDLVETFDAIRTNVEAVIKILERHKSLHSKEHFYRVRAQEPSDDVHERAARLIYLNKTCFNGLYRVNRRGLFNVPFGQHVNPAIFDPDELREASACLRNVELGIGHFSSVAAQARRGDFVYFDPPYHPRSSTAYFTSYTESAFGPEQQEELADVYRKLAKKGCHVMLSNSDTPFIHKLYRGFDIKKVRARRNINVRAERRGHINEVVVLNYAPGPVREDAE